MHFGTTGTLLLDDGEYLLLLKHRGPLAAGLGYLFRRCRVSEAAPEGLECVGGYDLQLFERWSASITVPYDAAIDSDCLCLGCFNDPLTAICTLWRQRHLAFALQPRP